MKFTKASDIQKSLEEIILEADFGYINARQVVGVRSWGSKSRARARIWAFPTIWQEALGMRPHYVIEVLSEKFDHLSYEDQKKILIHDLLHIPKTFSGALRPHRMRRWRLTDEVKKIYKKYF